MWPLVRSRFAFLDPGRLIDEDLELVPPEAAYIEDVLTACVHPRSLAETPALAKVTRQGLARFIETVPMGRHPGEAHNGNIPSYHFWMKLTGPARPLDIAGGIGLRVGDNANLRNYVGHLGYNVYPPARSRHLAERSCRLLFPLARRHGLKTLWITANPENIASRRTCERLGAVLVDIVAVPKDHELYARGEMAKCRYRIDL